MQGKRLVVIALACALALAAPARALDLDEARQQGLLGEQADGYVGVVAAKSPPEVVELAEQVNARRRAHYAEIASRNATPIEAVAALAGKKLVDAAPAGQWVKPDGAWVKKP
jgi:uncharacterized protein YdbL (DUF1318 family)